MLTQEQMQRLEGMSRIGKTVSHKQKRGSGRDEMGTVVDEVYIMVSDYKHMIQRIRFAPGVGWGGNEFAYRFGYYTYDASNTHIKWGQYTPFLTESEYRELLGKAKAKGWNIF